MPLPRISVYEPAPTPPLADSRPFRPARITRWKAELPEFAPSSVGVEYKLLSGGEPDDQEAEVWNRAESGSRRSCGSISKSSTARGKADSAGVLRVGVEMI